MEESIIIRLICLTRYPIAFVSSTNLIGFHRHIIWLIIINMLLSIEVLFSPCHLCFAPNFAEHSCNLSFVEDVTTNNITESIKRLLILHGDIIICRLAYSTEARERERDLQKNQNEWAESFIIQGLWDTVFDISIVGLSHPWSCRKKRVSLPIEFCFEHNEYSNVCPIIYRAPTTECTLDCQCHIDQNSGKNGNE